MVNFIGDKESSASMCSIIWMVSSDNIESGYLECRGFSSVSFRNKSYCNFFSVRTTCNSFKCCRMPLAFHKNMESGCKLFVGIIYEFVNDCGEK